MLNIVKLQGTYRHHVTLQAVKPIGQIEFAEAAILAISVHEIGTRTVGSTKLLNVASMSRKNRHCEYFPIGFGAALAGSSKYCR
jgi:hypothetical protein